MKLKYCRTVDNRVTWSEFSRRTSSAGGMHDVEGTQHRDVSPPKLSKKEQKIVSERKRVHNRSELWNGFAFYDGGTVDCGN